jgi:hypothetical protein
VPPFVGGRSSSAAVLGAPPASAGSLTADARRAVIIGSAPPETGIAWDVAADAIAGTMSPADP